MKEPMSPPVKSDEVPLSTLVPSSSSVPSAIPAESGGDQVPSDIKVKVSTSSGKQVWYKL